MIISKENGLSWVFNPNQQKDLSLTDPVAALINIGVLTQHLHALLTPLEVQACIESIPEYKGRLTLGSGELYADLSFMPFGSKEVIHPIVKASFNDGGEVAYYLGDLVSFMSSKGSLRQSFVLELN